MTKTWQSIQMLEVWCQQLMGNAQQDDIEPEIIVTT